MSDEVKTILCGNCRVPVERGDREGQSWGVCPQCGQNDSLEAAAIEAAKYHVRKSFGDVFKGLGQSGGGVTIKRTPMPHFRWVTAD